ncbi:TEX10, partial [Symbiodinium sp. KB8]
MVSWSGQRSSWDAALFSAVLALAHAYKTCETKHSHHVCSAGARCVNEKVWEANLNDLTCGPPQAWKVAAVKGLLAAATPQTRGSFALQRRQVLSKTKSSASKGSKRKAKDFTKVKNKVGKSKKAPLNETKTDFKVKKVQLPSQSALDEKGEEVTHRRLGLAELLAHLQHHSPKVRRDALRGLLELCKEHDSVLQVHLSRVLDSLAMVATDGSMDVRASFRSFQACKDTGYTIECSLSRRKNPHFTTETAAQAYMLEDAIAAFSTNLALQVRSALSHVSAEVREDGLKLLELYLSRLGSEQVLSHNEASRVVGTLCQLHSHVDLVLPCLLQLQPCFKRSGTAKDGVLEPGRAIAQVSMQDVLEGKLRGQQPGLEGAQAGQAQLDSQIWDFCLRAWMQAGDLP